MTGFQSEAPQNMQQILEDYSDIVVVPRIRCASNYLNPAFQLNIATAQHGDSGMCMK